MQKRGRDEGDEEENRVLSTFIFERFSELPEERLAEVIYDLKLKPLELLELDNGLVAENYQRSMEQVFRKFIPDEIIEYVQTKVELLESDEGSITSYWRKLYIAYTILNYQHQNMVNNTMRFHSQLVNTFIVMNHNNNTTVFIFPKSSENVIAKLTDFLNSLGYESSLGYSGPKKTIELNALMGQNDTVALLLFLLYTFGWDLNFEGTFISSCIGCSSEAKFKCECHSREYCNQACANKDHF